MGKTWKQVEREIAQRLGAHRVGCTGKATPDAETDWLAVEVKHRARYPEWFTSAMEQAEANAKDGQLPIVVAHQKYQAYDQAIVMMRLADFQQWFGE